jgi:hypothetical protein
MNFSHYQKAGDKVFLVNPHRCTDGTYVACINLPDGTNCDECNKAIQFNNWLSTQPTIYTDPSIKDGVYKVDELEIVWQAKHKTQQKWDNAFESAYTNCRGNFKEFCNIDKDFDCRQYATLKQPVKQEEKPVNIFQRVSALIDENGDWFVIPFDLTSKFFELDELIGHENMSTALNAGYEFEKLFSQYKTGRDLNNIELYANILPHDNN